MNNKMMMTRRRALQLGVNVVGSGAMLATLGGFERALAATSSGGDYRALVCVFLAGGCDTANLVVPRSSAEYALYSKARNSLALPVNNVLPMNSQLNLAQLGGASYGLHPSCSGLQQLYNAGRMAVVANTGSLLAPTTRSDILAGRAQLPPQLFSHIDQQRLMMSANGSTASNGWAGRIADMMAARQGKPELALNVSIAGNNLWQSGQDTTPYALGVDGAARMPYWVLGDSFAANRRELFTKLLDAGEADASPYTQESARIQRRAISTGEKVSGALASVPTPGGFPGSSLGQQLAMVARMISARQTLGISRQVFFVTLPGWDTHDNQLATHVKLLGDLSDSLTAFYQATEAMGVAGAVTSFTTTDFGRTLTANSDGSDHGWGAHHLVIGGGVYGGGIYGRMPSLSLNSEDDAGAGRMIPSTATEQFAATLARWFGVAESDLSTVFPTLGRFATSNLGFMAA